MDRVEIVARKIELKEQALELIQEEVRELRHMQNLFFLEDFLKAKIRRRFEPGLSARLDAVRSLIESFEPGGRPCALMEGSPDLPSAPHSLSGKENGKPNFDGGN